MLPSGKEPTHPNWTPAPVATPWDDLLDGIATAGDWAKKRPNVCERFLRFLKDEAAPPRPRELDLRDEGEPLDAGGFTIRRVSYFVGSGERAHAYLAVPGGPVPRDGFPAVLCVHGTTNWGARQTLGLPPDATDPDAKRGVDGKDFARQLVRAGFVTFSPEHFCCATRCPKEGPYDTAAFYRKHPKWSAVGKSTFENAVALDVLASLPNVDATRLGVTGHSLGGHNSIFLAAYDERIRCAVPSCGGPTINQNPAPLHWSRDHWYVYQPDLRAKLLKGERIACDYHEMLALAAPRTAMLDLFALNDGDPAMQAQRAQLHLVVHRLYRLLGREEAHAYLAFGDGHSMPDLTRTALVSWFARWLKHGGDPRGQWQPPY